MTDSNPSNPAEQPKGPHEQWARPMERISREAVPEGAFAPNLAGRRLTGPLQGFGPLWEKIYRVRLEGVQSSPQDVLTIWKENFGRFQPKSVHFHPPARGIQPGEVMPIDFNLSPAPGMPEIIPMDSGVRIIYSDDTAFTVMTPEGFPISGWNTFSVAEEEGCLVAQVYSLLRTADPVYEVGYRLMGGEKKQESDWVEVLANLAKHLNVTPAVTVKTTCLDPKIQWREAGNVVHNAAIRTFFHRLLRPWAWFKKRA